MYIFGAADEVVFERFLRRSDVFYCQRPEKSGVVCKRVLQKLNRFMNPSASLHSCAELQMIFLIILNDSNPKFHSMWAFSCSCTQSAGTHEVYLQFFPFYFILINTNWSGLTCGVAEL